MKSPVENLCGKCFHLNSMLVLNFNNTQRAHYGQTTLKQRCINVIYVEITLFKRRLTMNCPLGRPLPSSMPYHFFLAQNGNSSHANKTIN